MTTSSTTSSNTTPQRSQRIVSMRVQLLGLFTLIFTVVFSAAGYWLYDYINTTVVLGEIKQDLTDTLIGASKVAQMEMGDKLENLANKGRALKKDGKDEELKKIMEEDQNYKDLLAWLEGIHTVEKRAWPFLYVKGDQENQIYYVVDLQVKYDQTRAAFFMDSNETAYNQWKGLDNLTVRPGDNGRDFGIYTDEYGSWVTAYAPIYDSRGEKIGGMGIDFTADYVNEVRDSALKKVEIAFVLIFVIMFLLIWVMTGSFTRPITNLTQIADKIGAGDYQHQDSLTSIMNKRMVRDELSSMANAFLVMVDKVSTREQNLRQQVQELKIEINEAKRKAQVDEIVESDFFRDLKTKADKMRSRAQGGSSSETKS